MRLGREMHHVSDSVLAHNMTHRLAIAKIDLLKDVLWVTLDVGEVREMPGVGEAVQVYQPRDGRLVYDMPNEVRADETGAACDQ